MAPGNVQMHNPAGQFHPWTLLQELEVGTVCFSRARFKVSLPLLSRRQMELLLSVVIGCPEYLHKQTAPAGCARAGGPGRAPGQHVLLLPAAGLVLRVAHTSAPGPCVQPQQGRVRRGRQDHRGTCFGLRPSREFGVCAFNL